MLNNLSYLYLKTERYFGAQVVEQKTEQKNLTHPERIKQIIISEMENNPSISTMQLMNITGLKKTSIQNYIRELNSKGIIERVGAKKIHNLKILATLLTTLWYIRNGVNGYRYLDRKGNPFFDFDYPHGNIHYNHWHGWDGPGLTNRTKGDH